MTTRAFLTTVVCTLLSACGTPPTGGPDGGTNDGGVDPPACQSAAPAPALFSDSGHYTRELYIDRARGNDDADGSRNAPWRSLARAAQDRAPGDRVHILPGTYFECLSLDSVRGTAEQPIAFQADGEVRIVCMTGEAVAGTALAYVTFQGLDVLSSGGDGNGIHVDGGSHHVVVRHNQVSGVGPGGDCVKINATDDVWVLENDLHNADNTMGSAQGIDLVGVHRAVVRGNHVHDIADSQGIFAKGGSSDVLIERNLVERLASNTADAIGIVLGGVTDRQFFTPVDAGYEATRVIARNNIVIGADGAGIGAQGCHDCLIANNTLWNTGHHGYAIQLSQGATGMGFAANAVSVCVDVRVVNNLVGNPFGTMRAPIQAEPAHRQGLALLHNLWWNGPRDDVFDPGYNHDVGVDGPGSFVDQDPLVADAEGNDVHLTASSPARSSGVQLPEVTDDYDGHCRSGTPDLGALMLR